MSTADAVRQVFAAASAEDLFGTVEPARRYRRLARALHPDTAPEPARDPLVTAAFVRLTELWRGRHGGVIRTAAGEYRLTARRYEGDLADLYDVGAGRLLKLPRSPANNDLMEREARALRLLAERGDPRHLPYVPRLVESFRHEDPATNARRAVNVTGAAPNLYSLAEVRANYPGGLDPRDVAWMWRRLLVVLGFAHRAGVVHGAVLPPHVLIEPDEHGVVLVDWCYASLSAGAGPAGPAGPAGSAGSAGSAGAAGAAGAGDPDDIVPAIVPAYRDWYPAEVPARQRPGPGTDIAMATRCMTNLMGARAPGPLRAFAAGCELPALSNRPDDAWRLLDEFDGVLARLYGPRRFRPFRLTPVPL